MKRIVRWVVLAGIGGPAFLTLSCSGRLVTEARDAAIDGLGASVQGAVSTFLTGAFGL